MRINQLVSTSLDASNDFPSTCKLPPGPSLPAAGVMAADKLTNGESNRYMSSFNLCNDSQKERSTVLRGA